MIDGWAKIAAMAQVASAIATFAAVYVALKLASDERKIKLRVSAQFMSIISQNLNVEVMAVTVENIGHRKAKINGFYWSTGYFRKYLPKILRSKSAMQLDDYSWALNERFPWNLESGDSKSTYIRKADFLNSFQEAQEDDLFRKFPWSKKWKLFHHRIGVGVVTLPRVYFGKVAPSLTKELEKSYSKNRIE